MSAEMVSCMGQDMPMKSSNDEKIRFLEEELEILNTLVSKLLSRIETIEKQQQTTNQLMTGGTTKAAERALVLNEAVRTKGFLKRREASSLLECCHSETLRAMQEAASMFDDLCVKKNTSNRWVLAVVSE